MKMIKSQLDNVNLRIEHKGLEEFLAGGMYLEYDIKDENFLYLCRVAKQSINDLYDYLKEQEERIFMEEFDK